MNVTMTDNFMSTSYLLRGIEDLRQNNFYDAIWNFDSALTFSPDDKFAHWNKAMALLSLGEYEEGFKEHDWGWRLFDWRGFGPVKDDIDRLRALPMWEGDETDSLLVYHELGFGDAIQCMRYIPEIAKRASNVTLVINPELISLVRHHFGSLIEVMDHVPANLNFYDARLPFFGVMHALKQNAKNIPRDPYISPFIWDRTPHSVGLVWAGRTNSFKLPDFLNLFDHKRFTLHSLQPGLVNATIIRPLGPGDFLSTVQAIAQLEHIVTVDTGVAHLAGAMGHPSVHVLLPYQGDWRWWHSEVWYPTIKTYRQRAVGDWSHPFDELNRALK